MKLGPISTLLSVILAFGCNASPPPAAPNVASVPCSAAPISSASSAPPMMNVHGPDQIADELLRLMNAKDAAGIEALFNGPMRAALPVEKTAAFVAGIIETKGKLLGATREVEGGESRTSHYRFKAERGEWRVSIHVDKDAKIGGLFINEPAPPDPEVAKSTIALSLPVRGQWQVFWGGNTIDVNQHVTHHSQRRATDLLIVDAEGKTHRGDGKKNEEFYAYGQEVVAVADGTVITVIDGVPDNVPGQMNAYMAPGNFVVVKHTDSLYSAYAHFQPGKIRVKAGAKVKQGTTLGLSGNSGNSSEPHLHFQLQDGPLFERSWGVEPVFKDVPVVRNGSTSTIAEYTWLKGDLVGTATKK